MDYKIEFERKLVSADEAVKVVKSGDLVHYGEFSCPRCGFGQEKR